MVNQYGGQENCFLRSWKILYSKSIYRITISQPDVKQWPRDFSVWNFNRRNFDKGKFYGDKFHAGYFCRYVVKN